MHRDFMRLLKNTEGRSEYIIVVNLDIRGFTPFCQERESIEVGTYIKKVYQKAISEYFQKASFYKPAGDGLIITIPYDQENLREVANSTLDSCLKLIEDFGNLLATDPMINYSTPQKIGMGITRGSACCLLSKDDSVEKTLDYSGRILNLASRLMDMARPSGIVLDGSFGLDLLSDGKEELFSEEMVYIRGIAEEEPTKVYYSKRHTLIPKSFKQPLREPKWIDEEIEHSMKVIKRMSEWHNLYLSEKPIDKDKIILKVSFKDPEVKEIRRFEIYSVESPKLEYKVRGNKRAIRFDTKAIAERLEELGATEDSIIKFELSYPTK